MPRLPYSFLRLFGHLDWLAFGLRDRTIRYFASPEMVEEIEFEIDFFGLKYQGNLSNFIDWSVYFFGAYEREILLLMKDLVKARQNPVFIDVGANIGQHSLFMSNFCSEVHAFEPYDRVSALLKSKIIINNLSNIIVHDVGLGTKNEFLEFYAPVGRNIGTGSFMSEHARDNNIKIGNLELVAGDEYISKLKLPRIDLIKIDVEGFEKNVLIGIKDTLEKYRPAVIMEYSQVTKDDLTIPELKEILPAGYRIQQISTNRRICLLFNRMNYQLTDFEAKAPNTADLLLLPG